ncbi:MAG: hypothetical protein N2Z20_05735 [Elusimicrobiales bacterium]|nr:hypothetical protein [Elusimicrobiales bacterium]
MIIIINLISFLISAQPQCSGVTFSTPCYGNCQDFIDRNINGICDIWEKYNALKKESENKQKLNYSNQSTKQKILNHALIHIIIISIIIVIIAELLIKKLIYIRIILNWILLLSATISSLTGFFLYFSIFIEIKKILYTLHIQSSTIFFIIATHHTVKRFKCMLNN